MMIGLLLIAGLAQPAPPGLAPATVREHIGTATRCVGPVAKHAVVGRSTLVHFKDKSRAFVDAEPCHAVYPIGRAVTRRTDRFGPKGNSMKAFILEQNGPCRSEDEGGCNALLVLKDPASKAYVSTHALGQCNGAWHLASVAAFTGRKALMVECLSQGGGDVLGHTQTLVAYAGGQYQVLVTASVGYSMGDVGEATKGPICRSAPSGAIKVIKAGANPVIELGETDADPNVYEMRRLRWDGKTMARISTKTVTIENPKGSICAKPGEPLYPIFKRHTL